MLALEQAYEDAEIRIVEDHHTPQWSQPLLSKIRCVPDLLSFPSDEKKQLR